MKPFIAIVLALALAACQSPCPPDSLSAAQIQPTIEHILSDHERMINGALDPATLTDIQREVMLGDVEITREVIRVAALRAEAVAK